MQEIDFYEALRMYIRQSQTPITVIYTSYSESKNEGGQIKTLENVVQGPVKNNVNDEYMIGLKSVETNQIVHIYIHSILEIIVGEVHYKLILK